MQLCKQHLQTSHKKFNDFLLVKIMQKCDILSKFGNYNKPEKIFMSAKKIR